MTDEPQTGGAGDISDTPGPEATAEQEALVRGLLGSLRADDPGMPDDVVARIGTALALEARRGPVVGPTGPTALGDDGDDGSAASSPDGAPVTVLPRQADRAGSSSRAFRWVAGAAAALVVLVGGGAVVRQLGAGSGSSTSASSAGASMEAADKAAGALAATGTAYSRDTLATQVASLVTGIRDGRVATASDGGLGAPTVSTPAPSTSSMRPAVSGYTTTGLLTAATLPACLEQLTGRTDEQAVAVDSGTYAGKVANVIVLRDDQDPATFAVWVVGPLCTRDNADLLEWQSVPAP